MIPRRALRTVRNALDRQAAVALLGPRQVDQRFVVYSGDARFPVSADLEAIGVRELAKLLAAA